MEKPDIFPAAMLTVVTDPAAKYSITFTLRDYIYHISTEYFLIFFPFLLSLAVVPAILVNKRK